MKNIKKSKNLKRWFFKNSKFFNFLHPSKKIFGQFMIKIRKTSKKPHGSKFR